MTSPISRGLLRASVSLRSGRTSVSLVEMTSPMSRGLLLPSVNGLVFLSSENKAIC